MGTALIIMGGVVGYGIVGSAVYAVAERHHEISEQKAGGLIVSFWPFIAPAFLSYYGTKSLLDAAHDRRKRKALPRARSV